MVSAFSIYKGMKIPQILLRNLGMIEDFCHCFQVNNAAKKAKVQFSKDTKGDFSGKSKNSNSHCMVKTYWSRYLLPT